MLNKIEIQGRLVREPELRSTQANVPVAAYTLAVDRGYKNPDGKFQTDFIDCVAWAKKADFASMWMHKGAMFIVTGRLQSRKWKDKQGNNRISWEVIAEEQIFCGSQTNHAPAPAQQPEAYSYAAQPDTQFSELDEDDGEVPF